MPIAHIGGKQINYYIGRGGSLEEREVVLFIRAVVGSRNKVVDVELTRVQNEVN